MKSEFVPNDAGRRIAVAVTIVSGLFSLVVCVLLITNYLQVQAIDPLDNAELLRLREEYAKTAGENTELADQIRAMDLLTRKAYFTSQDHLRMGGLLLLGGVVVFLTAFRLAARWTPKEPAPQGTPNASAYWHAIAQSRELVTGTAVILVLVALTTAYLTPDAIPVPASTGEAPPTETTVAEAPPAEGFPTWEEVQEQWPSLRGPGGYGVAVHTNVPTQWDAKSGDGIRWKVEDPLLGYNSPVVWGTHLFLSGATEEAREVACFDTETGGLLWRNALPAFPGTPATPPDVTEDTGWAAPTMAVHGDRAFAMFGTGDLACYDFEGNLLWGRNVGVPENHYGHSSSLIAHKNLLFVQFDDKANPRVMALDVTTGDEVWAAKREKISWASPACVPTPFGTQLFLASEIKLDAYDPDTGTLLWSHEALDGEVAPSPTYANDTVIVANEYAMATAVRLGGTEGAVTSEIAWQWEDVLPEVSSPIASDDHVYIATSMGDIVCLDLQTGEEVWLEEFDEGFYSSPIRIGDLIYVLDLQGTMHIFRTGAEFEVVAQSALGERTFATPAFLDNRIYVRTEDNLICIEGNAGS
ncbi:MAG: PQQ-binding-like beta-propeller repeat protein [bacterium]|nr:PQQ-binding-like beta-propeller repeat protein [bacterium]